MTRIKIVVAGVVLLGVVAGWLEIKALKADKVRLVAAVELARAQAVGLRAEADTLRREVAAGQSALMEREGQKADLAAQTKELRSELEELYRINEPCAVWADGLMPESVYSRLRK